MKLFVQGPRDFLSVTWNLSTDTYKNCVTFNPFFDINEKTKC